MDELGVYYVVIVIVPLCAVIVQKNELIPRLVDGCVLVHKQALRTSGYYRSCWSVLIAPLRIYQTTLPHTVSKHLMANSPITNHYLTSKSLLLGALQTWRCVHTTKLCKRQALQQHINCRLLRPVAGAERLRGIRPQARGPSCLLCGDEPGVIIICF